MSDPIKPNMTTDDEAVVVRRSTTRLAIIATACVVLIGLAITAAVWRPWEVQVETHAHTGANKYTCPMHPQVINDGPGICPICFMDLVPMKAAGTDTAAHGLSKETIALSERGRITASVATTTVTSRTINAVIEATGGVDYNEATHRVVTARTAGRIDRLYVDETGQYVQKGAPLMELYSPELVAAQGEYLVARQTPQIDLPTLDASSRAQGRASGAERLVQSARRRLELLGMSAAQIASLDRRGTVAPTLTMFAPVSGVVLRRGVTEGAYVNVGTLVVELVDLSTVYVIANVLESDSWRVREGMPMTVSGPALGGETMHGSVDYIYPTVDAASRTVRVRGIFANSGMRLKPGMYVSVRLLASAGEALAIPAGAVIRTGERDIVFMEVAKNTYEARDVKIGARVGDYYELVGGTLNKGDRIVAEGGYLVDSESRLSGGAR